MALTMLSWLKPRGVVVGGSLLRIGSSTKKKQLALSIFPSSLSASSSSSSSSSSLLSSLYDIFSSSFTMHTYRLVAFRTRGVVVGGGSLLRIGSSMKKKKQPVLSIFPISSSSSSSSSLLLSSSYDQASYSSRHTYGLVALGMLLGSSSNNNNNQTTHSSPASASASASAASFISSELIGSAAKIYRYSSPQQCTYGEALEYAGIPRDCANTEACKLRLMREINIANAQHNGLPRFGTTKGDYIDRYKTIYDSIPLSVSIANKHGRLLKMLGLPELPPGSILVGGKKEFLPSIYIINSRSGRKTASAIAQQLGRKAKAWTGERVNAAAAAASTTISNNYSMGVTTTSSVHLITDRQEILSPLTVDSNLQETFARMTGSSSSSTSTLAPVSLLTSASELNSFEPQSSVSASTFASSAASTNLFESSPFLADLQQSDNFVADDDSDLASLESGPLIEPSTRKNKSKSSRLITSLSSKGITRNTIDQEQAQRQEEERQKGNRTLMHKLGSLLWKGSVEGETDLKRFDSADKCAELINRLFKFRAISGYQISNAVREKKAGLPPPELGRPTILSSTVFDLLCRFFFSFDSVNQANATDHNERSENISLLDRIVNEHRKRKGEKVVDAVHLYKRILHANSLKQEQVVPDTRESHRLFWLTHHNQKRNHERFEEATVDLGIARPPVNDEEKEKEGNVVFEINGEDTKKNVIFFDETAIFLDASECGAGRQGSKTSNPNIPNVGKAGSKSSDKFTLLTAVNGNCELLPFLTIIPSKAQPGKRKINPGMLMGYQQLQGKYGCLAPQTHSCTFASTPKGGMSNECFHNWVTEHLPMYYPGTCDEDGRRLIGKVDGGTGRNHIEALAGMMLNDMHLFTGTPNCTEANQEIDQLFGAFKSAVYSNRDKLFRMLVKINGAKARLTVNDMGYIIFGGRREFKDNNKGITHIDLANATEKLDKEHICKACEKVGYVPATRASLNHRLVRHQQVYKEDTEGNLTADELADPMSFLMDELEKELHDVIDLLVEEGMTEAEDSRVYLDKVVLKTNDEGEKVLTKPNTREHQDMLQNYRSQGDFFRLTDGGAVSTSPDMIIALERKRSVKVIKELEKEKTAKINYQTKLVPKAKKVFKKKYPWKTAADTKIAMLYRLGPNPKEKIKMSQNADVIKEIYRTRFLRKSRGLSREELFHTRAAETKLELMNSGEFVDHTETKIWNDTINTQTNFLQTKWRNIPFKQSKEVLRRICSPHDDFPLSANQKREMADICLGIENNQSNDDDTDGDSVISEESLMELLSDDDDADADADADDDGVGVGDGDGDGDGDGNDGDSAVENEEESDANDSYSVGEESSSGEKISDDDEGEEDSDDQSKSTCSGSDSDASEASRDKNTRTGRSNRVRSNTRTRRGVQATVKVTTASMIAELKEKEETSDKQATFDEELLKMNAVLKKAKKCVEEGGNLTIPFLKALIKSKGLDPPDGRKAALIGAWNKVKDDADWERTVFFTEQDKKDLQLFEDDNSEDEE